MRQNLINFAKKNGSKRSKEQKKLAAHRKGAHGTPVEKH